MSKAKEHFVLVSIDTMDAQSHQDATNRLIRWLEYNGHTASGHGFEFISCRTWDVDVSKTNKLIDAVREATE